MKTEPINTHDHVVPHTLLLPVLVGAVRDDIPVEHGPLAAQVANEEERPILSGARRTSSGPPLGYRPCGRPPWGEP